MILTAPLLLGLALSVPQEIAVAEAPAKSNLDRALNTINADEIRSDLMFVASDVMGGRNSPSPQLKIAARFIRSRLMRYGFEPGAQEGSYLYEWQIHQLGFEPETAQVTISSGDDTFSFSFGEDYLFPDFKSLGMRDGRGGVVFGGDMKAGTLEGLDVDGSWVLSVTGKGVSGKQRRALESRGAIGVLVLPSPDAEKTVKEALGARAARFAKKRLSFRPSENNSGFPMLHLTESAMKRLPADDLGSLEAGDKLDWTLHEKCAYGDLGEITLENVAGIWPGSDPDLKDEVIILSAHYDHVGERADGTIFNGADDNGSGTCGMLAIAEALKEYGPMRRSVMLMWVSAEEKGLLGSEAWTKDPYLPGGLKPICNINIDMIGRNASNEFLITPTKKHPAYSALTQVAEANAEIEGFTKIKSADAYWARSDHANFEQHMGLPVAFLFCDVHEDYHQPSDTPDKIDYDKMRRICRLVVRMLEDLQVDKPKF